MYADVLTMEDGIIEVNGKSPLFKEHFPGFSVLPGAFSVGYCIDTLLQNINANSKKQYSVNRIRKVSFIKTIEPNVKLNVCLIKAIKENDRGSLVFSLNDELGNSYLKGMLIIGEVS